MALADDLLTLKAIQVSIRNAIEAKGVTVGDDEFATYPAHILSIQAEVISVTVTHNGEAVTHNGEAVVVLIPA